MNHDRVKKALLWAAVITIFAFSGLNLQARNEQARALPRDGAQYTRESVERTELELAQYKWKWRQADSVLMDIAAAEGKW